MPTYKERVRAIVRLGCETARTQGGWQLNNIRFALYPNLRWVLASLDRPLNPEDKTVVWANSREIAHRVLDDVMDEMERYVTAQTRGEIVPGKPLPK